MDGCTGNRKIVVDKELQNHEWQRRSEQRAVIPYFPKHKPLKSSGKKFKASKGKIPEKAQLPFITQGLNRSWSPKGQTGSKRRQTSLWKRRMLCETQWCRGVFSKKSWNQTAGSWETPQGEVTPGSSWASHSDHGQGQVMRGMDLAQEIPSSIPVTSWWEFGDSPSAGILSWVFHTSTSCSSGQWWIRSADSKGKSWSSFCSKN